MSLISLTYFAFLIVVLFLYYKACRANQWIVLLAASLVFYVWAKPVYLLILAISICTTWALCLKPNKIKFAIIIAVNLGLLSGLAVILGFIAIKFFKKGKKQ